MDTLQILRILQVALGIGAVIFVHEMGHFIAARLCGVRVDVFSLGFGPPLLRWRRGDTTYQLAAVPLGGYVRMAGEEGFAEGAPAADDELGSKSVPQRFLIYSGGVIMNVVFAIVVFPLILAAGVVFVKPEIGRAVPGGPAWHARIPAGTQVLGVNGHEVPAFMHIANEVALAGDGAVVLELLQPGDDVPRTMTVESELLPAFGFPTIGIAPPLDPEHRIRVDPRTPAHAAGLRTDDRILEVVDGVEGLPVDEQLEILMERAEPVELRVARGDEPPRTVRILPARGDGEGTPVLGVTAPTNLVADLRTSPLLEELGLRPDDRLLAVNGQRVLRASDALLALLSPASELSVRVDRGGKDLDLRAPAIDYDTALALYADLHLAPDVDSTRIVVFPGSPAERAGLRDGDQIDRIDGVRILDWQALVDRTRLAARSGETMTFTVLRPSAEGALEPDEVDVTPQPYLYPSYGIDLLQAHYTYRAPNVVAAARLGLQSSWKFFVDTWTTLKRMLQGRVSSDNVGGIITIARVSYDWTSLGITKLLFFLCILSLNLAFLNVLPIPLLDGGHLAFLVVEGIKGSPVSERVLGYSQMIGLVMLVSLLIYATINDIKRLLQ